MSEQVPPHSTSTTLTPFFLPTSTPPHLLSPCQGPARGAWARWRTTPTSEDSPPRSGAPPPPPVLLHLHFYVLFHLHLHLDLPPTGAPVTWTPDPTPIPSRRWWRGGCTNTSPGASSRCSAPPAPPAPAPPPAHPPAPQVLSSELIRRVAAWHDNIGPKLEAMELRKSFDIHAYGG